MRTRNEASPAFYKEEKTAYLKRSRISAFSHINALCQVPCFLGLDDGVVEQVDKPSQAEEEGFRGNYI
jgi:hypothetical protein